MAKDKMKPGPKSPHSDGVLEKIAGRELHAWAAAELDGFTSVVKKVDGTFDGNKGGKKPIPNYTSVAELNRLAAAKLTGGRRLVLTQNGVAVQFAGAARLELMLRALILESMHQRGAL